MATNIRGDYVVDPTRLDEFDRVARSSPMTVAVVGGAFFAFSLAGVALAAQPFVIYSMLLLSAGVVWITLMTVRRLSIRREVAFEELTRDISILRELVVLDEGNVDNIRLWAASAIGEQVSELDVENEALDNAFVLTPEQEDKYDEYMSLRRELANQVLDLVSA